MISLGAIAILDTHLYPECKPPAQMVGEKTANGTTKAMKGIDISFHGL